MITIGPRVLTYVEEGSGQNRPLEITLQIGSDSDVELASGTIIHQRKGAVSIVSDWFSWRTEMIATDDVQLVYRLMTVADAYIRGRRAEDGVIVYADEEGDMTEPLDVFR